MIRGKFLTDEERKVLTELAQDGMAEHRLARRANAILLLDKGWSCEKVAEVLYLDDDTIRECHRLFERDGVDGLAGFYYGGRACELTAAQQEELKAWVAKTLPRTTRMIGAWIERQFGVVPMRGATASLDERVKLHFIPAYSPHLNPIERLWGLMHRHLTHNKCYASYSVFCDAMLDFLRDEVPARWDAFRDTVSDNFRVIAPEEFRVLR